MTDTRQENTFTKFKVCEKTLQYETINSSCPHQLTETSVNWLVQNITSWNPTPLQILINIMTSAFHLGLIWFQYYHRKKTLYLSACVEAIWLSLLQTDKHSVPPARTMTKESPSAKQPLTLQLNSSVNTIYSNNTCCSPPLPILPWPPLG